MTNPYYNFTVPFIPGTKVRSDQANTQFNAIEVGFDNLPADATAVVRGVPDFAVESGSGNAYVVTMPNVRLTNQQGDEIVFQATHTNTGVSTLAVDAISAVTLRRFDGTSLQSGDIVAGLFYAVRYDNANTRFLVTYPALQTNVGTLTYAGPTALVGLTPITGSAVTVAHSDSAPALDQSISPAWTGTHTFLTHPIGVASGGTGINAGTSGGVLGYTATGVLASSVLLTANALVLGGGAGVLPAPLSSLGTIHTVLHGNAAGAPTFGAVDLTADVTGILPIANGGSGVTTGISGGIPGYTSTTTLTSSVLLTTHAIVLGGGAGATPTPLGSLGTTTTVLHGNAAGAPTFGAVSLTADVSGILPVANGGTNAATAGAALTSLGAAASAIALTAGNGLTGGGDLTANRSFAVVAGTGITVGASVGLDTANTRNVDHTAVTLSAGTGLTGGGDISANRSFALDTANTRNVDHTAVSISGTNSITGGGDITASRTLQLSGDAATPGNSKYYGTDGSGTKGFFALTALSGFKIASGIVNQAANSVANGVNAVAATHPATGTVTINVSGAGFSAPPAVVAQFSAGGSVGYIQAYALSNTTIEIDAQNTSIVASDAIISFICIGA